MNLLVAGSYQGSNGQGRLQLAAISNPIRFPLTRMKQTPAPNLPAAASLSDEQLALGVQQGQRQALAGLVERHHSPLLGYLYRLNGGDRPLAEDWVQESFLRVLRSVGQYRYPQPFKPWLYAIATNLARDHFKAAETRQTESEPDEPGFWQNKGGTVAAAEQLFIQQETQNRVAAAILHLPPPQRETIILRYYQDFSLAEIADTLNIPVGTVKSRLSLALARLKEVMRE